MRERVKQRVMRRVFPDRFPDFEPEFTAMYERCREFTMTGPERMHAVYKAAEYVVAAGVPGDFVECGVWRGGSSMLAALAFDHLNDPRRLWLYDTYKGMTPPGKHDPPAAHEKWAQLGDKWAAASLEDVRANM
jgi:O-methyltransferase